MLLSRARVLWLPLAAVLINAGSLPAAETWKGLRIMPKSDSVLLHVRGQIVGDVTSIRWPATVKGVNGSWLWVEDDGSTAHPRVAGWIRDTDVVLIDQAMAYFTNRLLDEPDNASMYWLRGVGWEASGENKLAMNDYQDAIERRPDHAHAHSALARVAAQEGYNQSRFTAAQRLNPAHPRLYLDWGRALETAKLRDDAKRMYEHAKKLSPNWWEPHYWLALLAEGRGDIKGSLAGLEDAIRRDPNCYMAYRERAHLVIESGKCSTPAEISSAMSSARRACDLSSYRNAECLKVLADALDISHRWADAERIQQMAFEYAGFDAKEKYLARWNELASKARGGAGARPPVGDIAANREQPKERNREMLPPPGGNSKQPVLRDRSLSFGQPVPAAPSTVETPATQKVYFTDRSGFAVEP